MTNKQIEILNFLKKKMDGNNVVWDHESKASMFFDEDSKLFNIKIDAHTFTPGDYDSIEQFTIDVSHMLALAYELNFFCGGDSIEN